MCVTLSLCASACLKVVWTPLFEAGSTTLAARVRLIIARRVLIFRLRVIRSMFIPGALYGIEASLLADTGLRGLRTYL